MKEIYLKSQGTKFYLKDTIFILKILPKPRIELDKNAKKNKTHYFIVVLIQVVHVKDKITLIYSRSYN